MSTRLKACLVAVIVSGLAVYALGAISTMKKLPPEGPACTWTDSSGGYFTGVERVRWVPVPTRECVFHYTDTRGNDGELVGGRTSGNAASFLAGIFALSVLALVVVAIMDIIDSIRWRRVAARVKASAAQAESSPPDDPPGDEPVG